MAENSHGRRYINLSNKRFDNRIYEETRSGMGYKPMSAFWCSLESLDNDYYSAWDEMYGEIIDPDENGLIYATTVEINSNTYVLNPASDEVLLEGFQKFISKSERKLTAVEKRKLMVELIKTKKNMPNIEHVICQIDLPQDIDVIEKVFANYNSDGQNSEEVYENLLENVRGAFVENFSGVEVTDYALGNDDISEFEGNVYYFEGMKKRKDPKYTGDFGFWEMHSLAIFDTNCLDIINEIEIDQAKRLRELEEDERE